MTQPDYYVSAVRWKDGSDKLTELFRVHTPGKDGFQPKEREGSWITQQLKLGKAIHGMTKNIQGKWVAATPVTLDATGGLGGVRTLPLMTPRRKTFVSFYHKDDESSRAAFDNLTADLFTNKSVKDGEYDSELHDNYLKKLIQDGHLQTTTVIVVLVGANTHGRKHVDWEISGALNYKVGDIYAGLVGLILPSHPSYGKATRTHLPRRLKDNITSGYAIIADWTEDRVKLQQYVEQAFRNRTSVADKRDNSAPQLQQNTARSL